MINTHELAWAAGFFDGEGCVGSYLRKGKNRQRTLTIAIQQVRREPLDRFRKAVLGCGTVSGPYRWDAAKPHQKPRFTYTIHSFKTGQAVIAMLWKFLSEPKKEQALKALTIWHNRNKEIA